MISQEIKKIMDKPDKISPVAPCIEKMRRGYPAPPCKQLCTIEEIKRCLFKMCRKGDKKATDEEINAAIDEALKES